MLCAPAYSWPALENAELRQLVFRSVRVSQCKSVDHEDHTHTQYTHTVASSVLKRGAGRRKLDQDNTHKMAAIAHSRLP